MASEQVRFADLLANVVDNRGRTCPVAEIGVPLIATNCVTNDRLYPTYQTTRFVEEQTYSTWFRGHPEPGDILFVTKGSPGRVAIVPNPVDFCIAQDMVAIRADRAKVYPRYLFALLRSNEVQEKIQQLHVGTMIPHFKKGDFDKLHLELPDRSVQELVGDAYFAFSSKIELNRKMNETLEAMARALFKSWFVDFDPVRAKAEGRDLGLPAPIAALFPDSFEDSALGLTPVGWRVAGLDEIATFLNGLALQKYPATGESSLPAIKIAQLRAGTTQGADRVSSDVPSSYRVLDGDVLFSWSGSLECKIWTAGAGALNQHLFKVTSERYPKWFYLHWIIEHLEGFRQIAAAKATTMGHIQRHHLSEALVLIPPPQLVAAMDAHLAPILDVQINRMLESRSLALERDMLLPKLISGEIRVANLSSEVNA